jgi:transcription antitermination protein NusB
MTLSEVASRRRGREAALQILYQSEIGRTDLREVIGHYWDAEAEEQAEDGARAAGEPGAKPVPEALRSFANALARGTQQRMPDIDRLLQAHAQNWRLERMAVIDRLVLRLAVYELLDSAETPARVVINEAIELARTFSTEESVGFVNGILDAVRKELGRD